MAGASLAATPKQAKCSTIWVPRHVLKCSKRGRGFAAKEQLVSQGWEIPLIRDLVIHWCPSSPSLQFNQLAVANRLINTAWRRRTYALCKQMLRSAISGLLGTCPVCKSNGGHMLTLLDLEDVFNTELATPAAYAMAAASQMPLSNLRWAEAFAGYVPKYRLFGESPRLPQSIWGNCRPLPQAGMAPQSPPDTESELDFSPESRQHHHQV